MFFDNWLPRSQKPSRTQTTTEARRARPRLELLENRLAPTVALYTFETPMFSVGQTTPLLSKPPNSGPSTFTTSFTDTAVSNGYEILSFQPNSLMSGQVLVAPAGNTSALTLVFSTPVTTLTVDFAIDQSINGAAGSFKLITGNGDVVNQTASNVGGFNQGGVLTFTTSTPFSSATLQGFGPGATSTEMAIDNLSLTFTQAPTVACSVAESLLWPPNQMLENVGLSVNYTPSGASLKLLIYGNDNASPDDVANIGPGTLQLRSDCQGTGDGRVYLIVAQATNAGVTAFDVCTVVVPHDQSAASIQEVQQQALEAEASYRTSQTAPPGFTLLGDPGGAAAARPGGRSGSTHANDVLLPQESLLLSGGLQGDGTNHSLAPLTHSAATTTAPNQPALDQVFSSNSGSTAIVLSDETKALQLDHSVASWVDPLSEQLVDKLVSSLVPLA
jgi:hypothetical protein